jgi:hypothetical protein
MENKSEPQKIKLKYKYYLIKFSKEKKKAKFLFGAKKMEEIKKKIVGVEMKENDEIILIKLSKEKKFTNKTTGMVKLIGGPIKLSIKIFELTPNSVLKLKHEKQINRSGEYDTDKRNAQFLYLTTDYLTSEINNKDMELVGLLAGENKLEKRPFAPKLIDQIKKFK